MVVVDAEESILGSAEIRVGLPGGRWYAAPNLVYHYVTAHNYRPPDEFIEAVLHGDVATDGTGEWIVGPVAGVVGAAVRDLPHKHVTPES